MRFISLLACICSGLAITSCVVSSDAEPIDSPSDGMLTVDWTINGSGDPDACNQSSADTLEVTLDPGGTVDQSCSDFATSIRLAPGTYSATAVLLDANGTPRTTSVSIAPFTLYGGDALDTPIDFPANSFF